MSVQQKSFAASHSKLLWVATYFIVYLRLSLCCSWFPWARIEKKARKHLLKNVCEATPAYRMCCSPFTQSSRRDVSGHLQLSQDGRGFSLLSLWSNAKDRRCKVVSTQLTKEALVYVGLLLIKLNSLPPCVALYFGFWSGTKDI